MDIPVCGPASFALAAVSLLLLFRDIHQAAYVNSLVRIGARWCELSRYVPDYDDVVVVCELLQNDANGRGCHA
jgi:hypothetical protein